MKTCPDCNAPIADNFLPLEQTGCWWPGQVKEKFRREGWSETKIEDWFANYEEKYANYEVENQNPCVDNFDRHIRRTHSRRTARRLFLFFFGLIALLLSLWASRAFSHEHGAGSWINREALSDPISGEACCTLNDCNPATSVREVTGGYIVETGEFIPSQRVLWRSQDGAWWRCRVMGGPDVNRTRCLIGPPPGS